MAEANSTTFSEIIRVKVPARFFPAFFRPKGTSDKLSIDPSSVTEEGTAFAATITDSPSFLKVVTDESSARKVYTPTHPSPSQVTVSEARLISIVGARTDQFNIPHIAVDEFSSQCTMQGSISQVDVAEINTTQINRLQVNSAQVGTVQNHCTEVSIACLITPQQFLSINNSIRSADNASIWHGSVSEDGVFQSLNTRQISVGQVSTNQPSVTPSVVVAQFSSSQIGSSQVGSSQVGSSQDSISEISTAQVGINKIGAYQFNTAQVSPAQISVNQNTGTQRTRIGVTQVDINQALLSQRDTSQINSSEIPFASSIATEQFLSIHQSPPESIYTVKNSALTLLSTLLATQTPFDINLIVNDLLIG